MSARRPGGAAGRGSGNASGEEAGGGEDRARVEFSFDGRVLSAPPGSTVAAALCANGVQAWRRTRGRGEPRGLFCGIGACFDCLVEHNGRPAVRACVTLLHDGDRVATSSSTGRPSRA